MALLLSLFPPYTHCICLYTAMAKVKLASGHLMLLLWVNFYTPPMSNTVIFTPKCESWQKKSARVVNIFAWKAG